MESVLTNEEIQVGEVAAGLHVDLDNVTMAFGCVVCRELDVGFAEAGSWYSQLKVKTESWSDQAKPDLSGPSIFEPRHQNPVQFGRQWTIFSELLQRAEIPFGFPAKRWHDPQCIFRQSLARCSCCSSSTLRLNTTICLRF